MCWLVLLYHLAPSHFHISLGWRSSEHELFFFSPSGPFFFFASFSSGLRNARKALRLSGSDVSTLWPVDGQSVGWNEESGKVTGRRESEGKRKKKKEDLTLKWKLPFSAIHQVAFRCRKSTHSASAATLGRLTRHDC